MQFSMPTLIAKLKRDLFTPLREVCGKGILVTDEKGKSYRLKIQSPSALSALFQIDKYIITDGAKCDSMILVDDGDLHTQVLIELKGNDICHAIEQLDATLRAPLLQHKSINNRWARVVAQTIPMSASRKVIERAKVQFVKKYNCDLKLKSNFMEEYI